jgi:isopenicillin N synthase-like dioxygenase
MNVLTVDYNSPRAPELFCQSLKATGFAVLTYHPIPTKLIEDAYNQWRNFFATDMKMDYVPVKPQQDGYFPFRTEHAKNHKIGDLKEFYHYYSAGRKPPQTSEISAAVFKALGDMAVVLLQWIENHLPRHVAASLSMPLKHMVTDSPNTLLRILHYPPLHGEVEEGAERATAHEDINIITLLPAATSPGLEVKDIHGNWHAVSCDAGSIVVNVGDMLQMCTQGYYKSTTHRVVNPTDDTKHHSRYSMPLFLHARSDVRLSERYTMEEYLHERLREIGIY